MAIFGAAEMAALSNLCHEEEDTAMQPSQTQVVQRVGPNAVGEGPWSEEKLVDTATSDPPRTPTIVSVCALRGLDPGTSGL